MENKLFMLGAISLALGLVYIGTQYKPSGKKIYTTQLIKDPFISFMSQFSRNYNENEINYRKEVFKKNLEMIEQHNADSNKTYELGVNEFSDLTFEEFSKFYLSDFSKVDYNNKCEQARVNENRQIPDVVDWKAKGIVQNIKNQGRCGSCYAFSAIGGLESAIAMKQIRKNRNKEVKVPSLSEQEIVDCSREYGNQGCLGGLMGNTYDYILEHKINLSSSYPYRGVDQMCDTSKSGKGPYTIKSCKFVPLGVNALTQVASQRVVPVALYVQPDFMHYKSGIYKPTFCDGQINHGVLLYGYNKKDRIPFYMIKNSWGTSWGDKGYMKMAIGSGNGTCNIAAHNENYYPIL